MFANLFKPRWRHSDPEVRLNAISKLCPDQPDQARILRQLALHDASRQVRIVAVGRLSDTDSLLDVLSQSTDPEVREQAGLRVSECLNGDGSDRLSELLRRLDDADTRTQIIINVSSEQLQQSALNCIDDESVLMQVALHARLATMRREAAQRVERADLLENLQRQSRGRDKTVHRISRDKLNRLREQARLETEHAQRRTQLLQQLEQLARGADLQFLHARSQALSQEWHQLPAADNDSNRLFTQWIEQIQARLEATAEAERQEQELLRQKELDRQTAGELLSQLETLATDDLPEAAALQDLQHQWHELSSRYEPASEQQQRWHSLSRHAEHCMAATERLQQQSPHIESLLQQQDGSPEQKLRRAQRLFRSIEWPDSRPLPDLLQSLQAQITQLQQAIKQINAQSSRHEDQLLQQLHLLEQQLDQGEISTAESTHRGLAPHFEQPSGLPESLDSRYRQLTARLAELKDWQGFAANGKKETLCLQMEALVGAELPPQALADQIRALQQEWKQIDHTDPVHSQKLWKRFHDAGEKAYAPCQAWFSAQRHKREHNLQQRREICAQLDRFIHGMDWSQADWHAVEAISRTAREEWRQFSPVDRAPGKPVQQQFNSLLRDLDGRIRAHRQACADLKERIIARASELASADDIEAAAREAKQLQQQWKAAGATFRSRERGLWQAFREQCDLIFSRLKQARKAEAAQKPTAPREALLSATSLQALQRLAQLAEQAEEELAETARSETLSTLLTEAVTGPSPGQLWRERIGQRLEAIRLISAGSRSIDQQLALSEVQARELCIRLEIMLGQPTPEEDEVLRMEYQMERLGQALAEQDDEPSEAALQSLELEWLTLPFAWQFVDLRRRFAATLTAA
ncbi:DUF349 domain-containing protein [Marinobacterium sp. MBR-109]|jgi:hypothetical protein|uniref:DUF349 domain-containing protein n=1 Tax=Marinobacterium sp. MBR-109 TaxID=3156462 RepID=UPI00339748D1